MKKLQLLFVLQFLVIACFAQDLQTKIYSIQNAPINSRQLFADSALKVYTEFPVIENDVAWFVWKGTASSVHLAGDHNQWSLLDTLHVIEGTNYWICKKVFLPDARIDYKLVINKTNWILDPKNPKRVLGGFGENSSAELEAYKKSPFVGRSSLKKGIVKDTTITSYIKGTKQQRNVKIYLPYNWNSDIELPYILFHDGLDYVSLGSCISTLDYMIETGSLPSVAAIFIPAVQRVQEYRTSSSLQYEQFLLDTLLPSLEKRYSFAKTPSKRAVIGASDGGHCALLHAFSARDFFGKVAAQSTNVTSEILARLNSLESKRIWIDIGQYDIPELIPRVKQLHDTLLKRNIDHTFKTISEGHSWGNWKNSLPDILLYLFSELNSIEGNKHGLFRTNFTNAESLKEHCRENNYHSIVLFNYIGNVLYQTNNPEDINDTVLLNFNRPLFFKAHAQLDSAPFFGTIY